jgi:hypothetical protein
VLAVTDFLGLSLNLFAGVVHGLSELPHGKMAFEMNAFFFLTKVM